MGGRIGFTTGSCAAAGAKAATFMLLTGKIKNQIKITTPKGMDFTAQIVDILRSENRVSCAVIKDGGDDPDVTSGCHVVASVSFFDNDDFACALGDYRYTKAQIRIEGGKGVGVFTKQGLDQTVGSPAINSVPRQMIEKEVLEVCELCDYKGGIFVEISVPEGEELAKKTFNPRLGIKGGISILGTSGIVEPMSSQALLDTIFVELRQQNALGQKIAVVSPGNYGLDFIKREFNFDLDRAVKCSNFIGEAIDMAAELGFEEFLLVGHIGKLIKLSGGIMNTHSKIADCRMELLGAAALKAGCSGATVSLVLHSISTEEGCKIIMEQDGKPADGGGLLNRTMDIVMERIMFYMNKRCGGKMKASCITFCNRFGLLAESSGARNILGRAGSAIIALQAEGLKEAEK